MLFCAFYRAFNHVVDMFLKDAKCDARREDVTVSEIWPWINRMWNRCSFVQPVTRQHVKDYLVMRFQHGGYIPNGIPSPQPKIMNRNKYRYFF